jgi:adenine-specific DNA-methyltransferase
LPDTPVGFSNPDNDPRGPWKADPFQVEGERPNQLYKITNPKTGREYFPNPGCSWKNDYNKFQELLDANRIVFGTTGEAGPQRKRFWSEAQERGRVAKSLWIDVDTTANATSYLELLTGKKVFTNPKPVDLIQRFIQLGTKNEGDIVLDFFGGSGTAAEAVFRQNIADNKKRSFIFVTLPEIIDETTLAGKNAKSLGCETISEVARLRINKAIEKIKKEDYLLKPTKKETEISKQDLGYKFFTCGPSNFKIWRSGEIENENDLLQQLSFFDKIEKQEAKELDLVYEIIIKNGFDLNSKVEKILIAGTVVYNINSFLILLATKKMNIEIASQLCEYQPKTIICLDSVFKNHDSLKTNIQLLFEESGITFKTI